MTGMRCYNNVPKEQQIPQIMKLFFIPWHKRKKKVITCTSLSLFISLTCLWENSWRSWVNHAEFTWYLFHHKWRSPLSSRSTNHHWGWSSEHLISAPHVLIFGCVAMAPCCVVSWVTTLNGFHQLDEVSTFSTEHLVSFVSDNGSLCAVFYVLLIFRIFSLVAYCSCNNN